MRQASDNIPVDIVRSAATWVVRMQSAPADAAVRRACDEWRARHPHHDLAWQRLQTINADVAGGLGRVASPNLLAQTLTASLPDPDRRRALKLLAVVAAGGVAWNVRDHTPWAQWTADYATATGERRTVALPDNSQLQLDTASAVDVRYSDSERLLVLARGGLRIATGRDAQQRPLRVRTHNASFDALGTVFTLRHEDGVTRLDVEAGAVAVVASSRARQVIDSGGSCIVDRSGIRAAADDGMKAGGWADGVIDTRSMRLGDFIAEVARYRRGYLGCDAAIVDLRLSGVYRLDDTDELLDVLQRALPIKLAQRTRWWVRVVPA